MAWESHFCHQVVACGVGDGFPVVVVVFQDVVVVYDLDPVVGDAWEIGGECRAESLAEAHGRSGLSQC